MSIRLIGGKYKGRVLKSPKNTLTRPTSAILRKSVFDICAPWIQDAKFLDVFAGSGAMGLEALSRGAQACTFIEKDRNALECVYANISLLKLDKNSAEVLKGDAVAQLEKLKKKGSQFDIVYLDPPYSALIDSIPLAAYVLKLIDQSELLAPGAIIFVEEAFPSTMHLDKIQLHKLRYIGHRQFSKTLLHEFRTQED